MANWSMILDVTTGKMRPIEVLQEPGWIDGQAKAITEAVEPEHKDEAAE